MTNAGDLASLLARYRNRGWRIVTAESCTGGLVAAALTEAPGSSDVFDRGFVTYSNEAKTDLLGVPAELISRHGAVSAEVAQAMVLGALERSQANVAVAVTGIAGPSGATPTKPIGLVFIACRRRGEAGNVTKNLFKGDRAKVRERARDRALVMLWRAAE